MQKLVYFASQPKRRYLDKDGKIQESKACVFHGDHDILHSAERLVSPDVLKHFYNSDEKNLKVLREGIVSGYSCEIALKQVLGLPIPTKLGNPDGGVDFTYDGVTYDICSRSFKSGIFAIPERKADPKADYLLLITREDNYKKNDTLNPPVTYTIDGAISKDVVRSLRKGEMYSDDFLKEHYNTFVLSASSSYYAMKHPEEHIDTEKQWQEEKAHKLFFFMQDENGKWNKDLKFFNDSFPLVQSLLKVGIMKIG